MPATVLDGKVVFRQWHKDKGLSESPQLFYSLDELYAACLAAPSPELIDRLIISGTDGEGKPRTLTFVFQSITVSDKR